MKHRYTTFLLLLTLATSAMAQEAQTQETQETQTAEATAAKSEIKLSEQAKAIDFDKPMEVYNLCGQLVGNSLEKLPKGVYIVKQEGICRKITKK